VRRLASCLALWAACGCGAPAPRPNLLLISIDTLRADRLACYGGPRGLGRALCELADAGTRYTWAFATAPATAPSVASILTGLYPRSHGVSQHGRSVLGAEVPTLAAALREAGYATAAFVSNPVLERGKRLDRGFDVYDDEMPRHERNRPGYRERAARETTDAALAWARSAPEPRFLWVHYQDPHGPYEPPGAAPPRDPPRGEVLPLLDDDSGQGGIPAYQALPGARTREAYASRYDAEIRQLDRQIARLVRGLDGLGRPPFAIATADHGEALGEDGYFFAHGHSVGLDQIRVPLLVRPAEPHAAVTVVQPVSLVDVAPTLLAAAGLPAPERADGRELPASLPGAAAEAADGPRALFAEHGRQIAVVRGDRYLARDRDPGRAVGPDGRPWGRKAPALPERSAELPAEPAAPLPAYVDPAADRAALEPLLETFLGSAQTPATHRPEVPAETEARLRALGYAE